MFVFRGGRHLWYYVRIAVFAKFWQTNTTSGRNTCCQKTGNTLKKCKEQKLTTTESCDGSKSANSSLFETHVLFPIDRSSDRTGPEPHLPSLFQRSSGGYFPRRDHGVNICWGEGEAPPWGVTKAKGPWTRGLILFTWCFTPYTSMYTPLKVWRFVPWCRDFPF